MLNFWYPRDIFAAAYRLALDVNGEVDNISILYSFAEKTLDHLDFFESHKGKFDNKDIKVVEDWHVLQNRN